MTYVSDVTGCDARVFRYKIEGMDFVFHGSRQLGISTAKVSDDELRVLFAELDEDIHWIDRPLLYLLAKPIVVLKQAKRRHFHT